MLLGTLGATLLGNILAGKGINRAIKGRGINRAGEGAIATRQGRRILRAGYGSRSYKNGFLMPPQPLTNIEIQKYYQNEPRFNGVHSRDNIPERNSVEIKDGAYVINLDEHSDI